MEVAKRVDLKSFIARKKIVTIKKKKHDTWNDKEVHCGLHQFRQSKISATGEIADLIVLRVDISKRYQFNINLHILLTYIHI